MQRGPVTLRTVEPSVSAKFFLVQVYSAWLEGVHIVVSLSLVVLLYDKAEFYPCTVCFISYCL